MQLSLFSIHITFKCVKVVNSKRGKRENKTSFQDEQLALAARDCSVMVAARIFALKPKLLQLHFTGCKNHVRCILG